MTKPAPYRRARVRYQTPGGGESMTDTQHGNDTDVNKIIERFARTGVMPEQLPGNASFQDVRPLQQDLDILLNKTADATRELQNLQKQATAAKAEQAQKDADDLAAFRAAASADQPEAPADPA